MATSTRCERACTATLSNSRGSDSSTGATAPARQVKLAGGHPISIDLRSSWDSRQPRRLQAGAAQPGRPAPPSRRASQAGPRRRALATATAAVARAASSSSHGRPARWAGEEDPRVGSSAMSGRPRCWPCCGPRGPRRAGGRPRRAVAGRRKFVDHQHFPWRPPQTMTSAAAAHLAQQQIGVAQVQRTCSAARRLRTRAAAPRGRFPGSNSARRTPPGGPRCGSEELRAQRRPRRRPPPRPSAAASSPGGPGAVRQREGLVEPGSAAPAEVVSRARIARAGNGDISPGQEGVGGHESGPGPRRPSRPARPAPAGPPPWSTWRAWIRRRTTLRDRRLFLKAAAGDRPPTRRGATRSQLVRGGRANR